MTHRTLCMTAEEIRDLIAERNDMDLRIIRMEGDLRGPQSVPNITQYAERIKERSDIAEEIGAITITEYSNYISKLVDTRNEAMAKIRTAEQIKQLLEGFKAPASVNVGFIDRDGKWSQTQLDLYSASPTNELFDIWDHLHEELNAEIDSIQYLITSESIED